jgi:hypothetical protein
MPPLATEFCRCRFGRTGSSVSWPVAIRMTLIETHAWHVGCDLGRRAAADGVTCGGRSGSVSGGPWVNAGTGTSLPRSIAATP